MRGGRRAAPAALAVLLLGGPGAAPVAAAVPSAPEALLLLVDYSGSMREPDGRGSTKNVSAERAVLEIVDALPDGLDVGMRAYGHRVPSADKAAACQDTEAVVPVGPLDRGRLRDAVAELEPLGETPIGLSLEEAARDLPAGVPSTVILVSDGVDECWSDDLGPEPCAVAADLAEQGLDLRLETIGLQVEESGREQLECMAAAGGGEFTSVEDVGLLADALAAARNRSLRSFRVRGEPVTGGPSLIDATVLGPGTYTDTILEGETLWFAVDLAPDQEVSARVTVRTAEVPPEAGVALEWQDADARRIDAAVVEDVGTAQASTLALSTGPADGSRSRYGAAREPGRQYLGLRVAGFPADVEHDFVLELVDRAEGDAAAAGGASASSSPQPSPPAAAPTSVAPQASAAPQPSASPPAASAAGAETELPPPPSEGGAAGPVVLVLLLVGAAATGLALLRRRRGRSEQEPPGYS